MTHLRLDAVHKRFGDIAALRDVSLAVDKGEFCALLGPSGCGKSTLLRLIAGLEDVSDGQIAIDGRDVTWLEPADRRIAMVFQSYALYPHMSVWENIAFSLEVAGVKKAERRDRAAGIARLLQLDDLLDRRPAALSGGQRQRVAIGRALLRDPAVFLFDEPLSNLDAILRVQMRIELSKLHQQLGATMIYVTHDQVEAMTMADRIVVMDRGRVSQQGAPLDLYENPANRFVASFIGNPAMSFLPALLVQVDDAHLRVRLGTDAESPVLSLPHRTSAKPPNASEVDIGIRPEHCTLTDVADAHLPGRITLVERLGNQTIVYVETAIGVVTVQRPGLLRVATGDTVGLGFDCDHAHVFDAAGELV